MPDSAALPLSPRSRLPRAWRQLSLFACAALAGGCAHWPFQKEKPRPTVAEPRYVGRIASVNSGAKFTIVDLSGFGSPLVGTELRSRSEGQETGRLRVSQEVHRPFAVADIVSGSPQEGDGVWLAGPGGAN